MQQASNCCKHQWPDILRQHSVLLSLPLLHNCQCWWHRIDSQDQFASIRIPRGVQYGVSVICEAGGLVDWWLICQRNVTQLSLGRQISGVDLKCTFLAVRVQRWTYVSHHPDTRGTFNSNYSTEVDLCVSSP